MCSLLRDPWGHLGFLLLGYQNVIRVPGATGRRTEVVQAKVGNPALLRQELVCGGAEAGLGEEDRDGAVRWCLRL